MQKTYVIDTSVLVHDPQALGKFEDNHLVLPITVIEELDGLKRDRGSVSYAAREVLRRIDAFRENGDLAKGVALPGGGSLRIALKDGDLTHVTGGTRISGDDKILKTAVHIKATNGGEPVVVVSKDTAVRIKSEALGIEAEDYKYDKTTVFKEYGKVISADIEGGINSVRYMLSGDRIFRLWGERNQMAIKRQRAVSGISPKNLEQECAIDALTAEEVSVIALTGHAGTGKTLLALASGIYMKEKNRYEQVLVARPVVPMGQDLGFLPGDVDEKLRPWMQPIFDNLDVIVGTPSEHKDDRPAGRYRSSNYLVESGAVHIEPLTYIRGRSLPRRFMIIDEAQNLRPLDVKTILTRAGEGTKVVLTGDLEQIDTPYLDSSSNGLAYLISRFLNEEFFCYLNLAKSARSDLAERAAELL
ncbi:MAG: PhoH family protein [Nitrospiraceae bacterium]|nr:PhoH family protein [Nitrospiraceae bacterium]